MNEKEHKHPLHDRQGHNTGFHKRRIFKNGFHRDWRVWVGVFLMLAAILYYIMSEDFALAPRKQLNQPSENNKMP